MYQTTNYPCSLQWIPIPSFIAWAWGIVPYLLFYIYENKHILQYLTPVCSVRDLVLTWISLYMPMPEEIKHLKLRNGPSYLLIEHKRNIPW